MADEQAGEALPAAGETLPAAAGAAPSATETLPAAAGAAVEEPSPYQIKIEDSGPATKKVFVEVPQELIASKLEEQFKQLRREAALPGFRPGHAPQKLVEKRFHNDVRDQVRRNVISESYEQAVSTHALNVIGEPQFDNPDDIKLPETGSLTYSFEVEVQPDFQLPTLEGLAVKKPKVEVTEEHLDQAMLNLHSSRARWCRWRIAAWNRATIWWPTFISRSMAPKWCITTIRR